MSTPPPPHLTVLIPCRSGSTRCPSKNSRPFSTTSLIRKKLHVLLSVPEIDSIVVSSDDLGILKVAEEEFGVLTHLRPYEYTLESSPDSASKLFHHLSTTCPPPQATHLMYATVVTPFISSSSYSKMINLYFELGEEYDSLTSVQSLKTFVYYNKSPLNFNPEAQCKSQNLPPLHLLTYGCSIIKKEEMISSRNCIGTSPFFYELNDLEAIDIDTSFDYVVSELIEEAGLVESIDDFKESYLEYEHIKELSKPPLLDCTLRDGGYTNNFNFTLEYAKHLYSMLSKLKEIEYMEIGYMHGEGGGRFDCVCRGLIERIKNGNEGLGISVMLKWEVFCEELFEGWEGMVRVLYSFSPELEGFKDCLSILKILKNREYVTALCLGYSMGYTNWDTIVREIKESDVEIDYIYINDTFGTLPPSNLKNIIKSLRHCLCLNGLTNVKIGFHGHNNLGDVLQKYEKSVESGVQLIDCCVGGLGRGGGNLRTESIVEDWKSVILFKGSWREDVWFITGKFNLHPNYGAECLEKEWEGGEVLRRLEGVKGRIERGEVVGYVKGILEDI